MAESVNLGNLSFVNGRPVAFGSASKLDIEGLVNGLIEAKRIPAVQLENKIKANDAKASAFADLRTLLTTLKTAANKLRSPPGLSDLANDVFSAKAAFVTSSTATAGTSLLGVTAAAGASAASYDVVVHRLARAEKFSSGTFTSNATDLKDLVNGGAAFSGTFDIALAGGTTRTIAVNGDMDIRDVASAINQVTADTGVSATVVKISDTDFRLVLTGNETGKAITLSNQTGDTPLAKLGLSSDGGTTKTNPIQTAQTAHIEIDGVDFFRTSNDVGDAIEGVTFNLFQADPANTLKVDIENNLSEVRTAITDFADAYNAFRTFYDAQRAVGEDGKLDDESVLFRESLLSTSASSLSTEVARGVAGLDAGALNTLFGYGVELGRDGKLTVKGDTLDNALLNDFDGLRDVFAFQFSAESSSLRLLGRTNASTATSFTVNITGVDAGGNLTGANIDGDASAIEISGQIIRGKAGTIYEGLEMVYTGGTTASIDVSMSQGAADRVFNHLDAVLDSVDGTLTAESDRLTTSSKSLQAKIDEMDERLDRAREKLIARFASLEATLSRINSLLDSVRSQVDAMSGSSN